MVNLFEKRILILALRITILHSCFEILSEQNHNTAPTEAVSGVVNFETLIYMYDSF